MPLSHNNPDPKSNFRRETRPAGKSKNETKNNVVHFSSFGSHCPRGHSEIPLEVQTKQKNDQQLTKTPSPAVFKYCKYRDKHTVTNCTKINFLKNHPSPYVYLLLVRACFRKVKRHHYNVVKTAQERKERYTEVLDSKNWKRSSYGRLVW